MNQKTKERIEKEARTKASEWLKYISQPLKDPLPEQKEEAGLIKEAYIAGATSEHSRLSGEIKKRDELLKRVIDNIDSADYDGRISMATYEIITELLTKA